MRIMAFVLVQALVIALVAGVGQGPFAPYRIVITEHDAGKTVSIPLHGNLVVQLPSNPTTGYRWQVVKSEPAFLQPGSRQGSFEADPGAGLGAGGRQTFTYRAIRPGSARLILQYGRPWEAHNPIRIFTIKAQIIRTSGRIESLQRVQLFKCAPRRLG